MNAHVSGLLRLCAACCVLAGCGSDELLDPAPPRGLPALEAADPSAPGPYQIGVTTLEAHQGARTLPVEVWYPAHPSANAEVTDYPVIIGVAELASIASQLGAVRDAPLALEGAPHPAIVFSHGNSGFRTQSVYLMEYLASHGFVVAAPDHLGNTLATVGEDTRGESALDRPRDVSATLDALLEASLRYPGPLYLAADPDRLGVAGHSFGGFTALRSAGAETDAASVSAACAATPGGLVCEGWDPSTPRSQRDPRFRAALAQTPGAAMVFEPLEQGLAPVDIPIMIQGGTHDEITPYASESVAPYAALGSPAYLLLIEGAGHFTFSNVCEITEQLGIQLEALSNGCSEQDADPVLVHAIANRYAAAFFLETLAGAAPTGVLEAANPLPTGVQSFEAK